MRGSTITQEGKCEKQRRGDHDGEADQTWSIFAAPQDRTEKINPERNTERDNIELSFRSRIRFAFKHLHDPSKDKRRPR